MGFPPDGAVPLTMIVGPAVTLGGFGGACGVLCTVVNIAGF